MNSTVFIIDSSFRDKSTYTNNNSFVYQSNKVYKNPKKLELIGAVIPNTQYIINSNNYQFNVTSGVTLYTASLTNQNYTPTSLATELQTKLNALAIPATTFTVTANTTTYKFTITSTSAVVYNFSLNTQLATLLGFPITDSASVTSITATNAYNIATSRYYKVIIKELIAGYDTNMNSNFQFIIMNDGNSGAYNYLTNGNNVNNCLHIENNINLNSLTIEIRDDYNNLVQLNGGEYILIFRITY